MTATHTTLAVVIACLLVSAVTALDNATERVTCTKWWHGTGFQSRWSFWQGCSISTDGRVWVSDGPLRARFPRVVP